MNITLATMTETSDALIAWAEKYHNDENIRQKIDSDTIDIKQEFGIDPGDTEVSVKVNTADTLYFTIEAQPNPLLTDTDYLSAIAGAKASESFETAQAEIGALSALASVTGLIGIIIFGGSAVGLASDIKIHHPEYFKDGTLVLKSPTEYYGTN